MKVFKRGGFVVLEDESVEHPIPVQYFDYQIIGISLKMKDVSEKTSYSETLAQVQDESGSAIGDADQIADYLADIAANSSKYNQLINQANDLVKTYTYLDAGTSDQRISTVVYSSVALGISATETFAYAGSTGSYRVSSITLS
jgi:hypothetical protein